MRARLSPLILALGLLALALVLGVIHLYPSVARALAPGAVTEGTDRLVLVHATLPRLALALLCGAGLSLSGAMLQQVLRNPLASPDTVGVSAGARLALALSALLAPGLFTFGRDLVAIAGAALSTTLVLLIARARRYAPLALILGGLVVSLYCGALATILVLLKDRYLTSLFIWGSGSLSQQSWIPTLNLALRLALCLIPLLLLLRPLALLDAGEQTARSLGISVERVRVLAVGVAVLMAAFVTSAVGMIGFVGLAGPVLTRLCRPGKFSAWCLWSGAIGALLLLVTDLLVQVVGGKSALFLPTGAVAAVLGAPLLLLLLPHLKSFAPGQAAAGLARRAAAGRGRRVSKQLFAGAGLVALLGLLVFVGRTPDGAWAVLGPDLFADVLPWRGPRMLGAAGAGCLLAAAGFVLQRLTGNAMASPEVLGVGAGAILGAAVPLLFFGAVSPLGLTGSAALGSFASLALVLSLSARAAFSPERVLLAGVALTALVDALIGVFTATGNPSSVMLFAWISGSAGGTTFPVAFGVAALTVVLLTSALLATRWLTLLPLGPATAGSVGVPVSRAQTTLLVLVAVMTAVSTPVIGPLTFVGLTAPHLVALLGVRHVSGGLLLSGVSGAAMMMLADTLARTIAFPLQLPTGILASLIAGPFVLALIFLGARDNAALNRKET